MSQLKLDLHSKAPASDDSSDQKTSADKKPLSVSQLNKQVKNLLEGQFGYFWIQGELSNFTAHSSGHWYFSIKDEKCQVSALMFRGFNSAINFKPKSGMEVLIRGKISVYEPRGNYQVYCEHMQPLGEGGLQAAFEKLKIKLQKEGLFDPSRKRSIPDLPKKIGVITSPTGAALQDIINVLSRRYKRAELLVIPALVQGAGAAESLKSAIDLAQRVADLDVLIVARGGGSQEDLWCFNDESFARRIAQFPVPVISAVGHEIDFTISDFVADLRAPTPSAAAELVAKSAQGLGERVDFLFNRIRRSMNQRLKELSYVVQSMGKQLKDPGRALESFTQRLDELTYRLTNQTLSQIKQAQNNVSLLKGRLQSPSTLIFQWKRENQYLTDRLIQSTLRVIQQSQQKLNSKMALLDSLSPLKVVDRGYSIVSYEGNVLKNSKKVGVGEEIEIRLSQGHLKAKVTEII